MKLRLTLIALLISFIFAGTSYALEGHDHDEHKGSMMEEKQKMREDFEPTEEAVNVGNKICPVSGEVIASVGDGKGVQIEHEGKIYNLCCSMCAKDFKKNPEKFIQKVNQELEGYEHDEHEEKGNYHGGTELDESKGSQGHDHHDHEH